MNLDDIGTRYIHYRELLDIWENALEILEHEESNNIRTSVLIIETIKNLKGAIFLMHKQIDLMSDYFMNIYKVSNEIEHIDEKKLLTEGNKGDNLKQ